MKKSILLFFAAILCAIGMNAATWTVAGSDAKILNGTSTWDPGDTKNDMTNVSGTKWGLLVMNKSLDQTTYKFKICKDHGWGTAYPGSDYNFTIGAAGTYNIIYRFNTSGNSVGADYFKTWTVAGSGAVLTDDWKPEATANDMTRNGNTFEYVLTKQDVKLEKGTTYECKVCKDHAWGKAYPNDNHKYSVETTGYYDVTFKFNIATETVDVTTTLINCKVTTSANPTEGGSVTATKEYAKGSSVTLTATPAEGYEFVNWTKEGAVVSTSKTYTFTVLEDVSLVANFKVPVPDVVKYQVTVSANNNTMGNVTGGGEYEEGETALLTATPNGGYQFKNWTVAGAEVSTTNPYTFTVNADITVTANFQEIPKVTVYAINSVKWDAIAVHHWHEGGAGTEWPGDLMINTGEKAPNGFDVYTATFLAEHENCIFNNNGNGSQTGTLDVKNGQYYDLKSNKWYASLAEVPTPDPLATDVFLVGSMNAWSTTANEFKKVEEGSATATLTMNLEAETEYEFKVVREGAWTSSQEIRNITGSVSELVFSSSVGDNTIMTTTVAGDYVFTWNDSKLSITYPASAEPEPTPDPAETETVYFVNADDWTGTIYAYAWTDGTPEVKNHDWPGVAAQKEPNPIDGHDVYSYTAEKGKYAKVIFNNNSSNQTSDMTWAADQYLCKNEWCADEDAVLAKLNGPIEYESVYFINTNNWSAVNIYTWSPEVAKWPGVAMTKEAEPIAGFDVYSYTVEKGTAFGGMKFSDNGGTQTGDLKWEAGKYYVYSTGEWYDTKEAAEAALAGPATIVLHGNFVNPNWADTEKLTISDDQKTATITVLIENGSYEFGVKQNGEWVANGKAFTKDNNEHEIVAGSGNLTLVADITGNYTFTWTYETNTLTITYPTEEVVIEKHYYVRGSHTNWEVDEDYELTLTDGVYKKEVTLAKDVEFKINDGDKAWWGKDNLGGKSYNELEGLEGGNLKMKEAKTFTIIFNPSENLITFEGLTEVETETLVYYVEVPAGTEKCYIAGQMNNWEFEPMTQVDATHWTITYDNVLKTTEYKYACQASWDYKELDKEGNDIANRTWTALDKVEKWAEPAEVKCYLMGNGDWVNGVEMEEDGAQFKLLAHHIYAPFKFKFGETWTADVENTTFEGLGSEDDGNGGTNITLPEGLYDFYFKKDTKKVYIALAGYVRNLSTTLGTICLPYGSSNYTGATFYEVVGKEAGKVYLGSVTTLTAGVPYIFESTSTTPTTIKVVYEGDKATSAGNKNGLIGTFTDETVVPSGNYILYGGKFCPTDGTAKVNAYRAYLDLSAVEGGAPTQKMPGRRYIGMDVQGENETTGVEDIFTTDAPVKVIENGQLIIIRDGVKYNVQGQKL